MNFEQFMSELYKIALEHIKKAGPVAFLVGAFGLYFYNKLEATESKLEATAIERKLESKELQSALEACDDQREKLAVRVSAMEVQIASYVQTHSVRKR